MLMGVPQGSILGPKILTLSNDDFTVSLADDYDIPRMSISITVSLQSDFENTF